MKTSKTTYAKKRTNDWSSFALALLVLPALSLTSTSLVHASTLDTNTPVVNVESFETDYDDNFDSYDDEDFFGDDFDDNGEDFENEFEDEFEGIISEIDWETLSQSQIDDKLEAAGKEIIGDTEDPLYNYTQAQIEALTDTEWDAIDAQYEALYGDDFGFDEDEFEGIISETDWDTLSQSQIDDKLEAAGKEVIGDTKDPLYNYTQAQIEALTDAEWDTINKQYEELYDDEDFFGEDFDEDEFEGIISETDWDTLSQSQIDDKLEAAGKEAIGDTEDPLYKMTPAQIDKLTEAEWEKIDAQYEILFADEFGNTEDDSDFETMEDEFEGIISETDWDILSSEAIDIKLKAAGKEVIGDTEDPLYKMTPVQIDKLTEAEWEKIDAQYAKIYGSTTTK